METLGVEADRIAGLARVYFNIEGFDDSLCCIIVMIVHQDKG